MHVRLAVSAGMIRSISIAILLFTAISLNVVWWYQLGHFTNQSNALSNKSRDVLFAGIWILVSLALVICLRFFKPVRRMHTVPLVRAIINCHTVGAATLVTLVWYDTLKNVDSLNTTYSVSGYSDLNNAKIQTSAFVFTVLASSVVHAVIEHAHCKHALSAKSGGDPFAVSVARGGQLVGYA